MVHRRRTGSVRFSAPVKRATEWFATVAADDSATLNANSAIILHSFDAAEKAKLPFTIMRIRGYLFVVSDQVAANEDFIGALGMAVVGDQATALGVTALPDPVNEGDSDLWFVHRYFAGNNTVAIGNSVVQMDLDSKAMRKVEQGQDFFSILRNASATTGFDFWLSFRMLIKIH